LLRAERNGGATDPDYHNAQRYRQTDGRTDRPTGHRRTTS